MHFTPSQIRKWIPAGIAGAILAVFYLFVLNQQSPIGGLSKIFAFIYLWGFFSLAVYALYSRIIYARLKEFTPTWQIAWMTGCMAAGVWMTHNIPLPYPPPLTGMAPFPGFHKLVFLLSAGFGIGLILFTVSLYLATRPPAQSEPQQSMRFRWLVFALPMLVVWAVYLLAFWPGMMSADSLDQWGQAMSGRFNDHHPAFHTILIWLLTRITPSPAVVALAQILALGLLAGVILAYFETLGVRPQFLWAASFVMAVFPVNGTMVATLWKDIPYSTAFVGFTYLILRLVLSRGEWIRARWNWISLGLTAALLSLLRQNGFPIAFATLLALCVAYLRQWRFLLASLALFTGLYLGVRGPFYQVLDVKRSDLLLESSTSLYSIAAYADTGSQTEAAFQVLRPFSQGWECDITNEIKTLSQEEGLGREESIGESAVNLMKRAPGVLLYSYRCRRSIVWIIYDPYGPIYNPSHAQYWIDDNPYGIKPDTKFPYLREKASAFVDYTSSNPKVNWLIWRPALFLYLFLLVVAVLTLKYKDSRVLLLSLPILLQSLISTIILIQPNFRYHYGAVLLALLFWPILFAPGNSQATVSGTDSLNIQGQAKPLNS